MKSIALLFPGQGSQSVGMMQPFAEESIVRDTFEEARTLIGMDLWAIQATEDSNMHQTEITQPLMLTSDIAIFRWLQTRLQQDQHRLVVFAGHSLGEYSALVAAGALSFAEALPLVIRRAQHMQQAVPKGEGGMAAILGLEAKIINSICQNISAQLNQIVEAVNFNTPEQTVIAGHAPAVQAAVQSCKEAGAKRGIILPVSVPAHSSLLRTASEHFKKDLHSISWQDTHIPIIHNNDARSHPRSEWVSVLQQQLFQPVQWVNSIHTIHNQFSIDLWVECGPGKILTGMLKRFDQLTQASFASLDRPQNF
jgi:[acyl-carrier-protein] S-malonyltransferase